jgi:hypothetical protein
MPGIDIRIDLGGGVVLTTARLMFFPEDQAPCCTCFLLPACRTAGTGRILRNFGCNMISVLSASLDCQISPNVKCAAYPPKEQFVVAV